MYLYTLHKKQDDVWFANQEQVSRAMKELENGYRQHFGEVKLLGGQSVDSLPRDPDTFVIAICLMICKQNGINFNSSRDKISYSVDLLDGIEVGTCRIEVNATEEALPGKPSDAAEKLKCTNCGRSVDANEFSCPHCGNVFWKSLRQASLITIGFLAIGAIALWVFSNTRDVPLRIASGGVSLIIGGMGLFLLLYLGTGILKIVWRAGLSKKTFR